jgi:phosphatidylserine/phosphatidylglycerophosphate/cardiolipin synthase-like enzyme
LHVAPLYYAPTGDFWQVGKRKIPAGNHAKVYIIDDTHFYVGSDNMYLSGTSHGLQEYGHLIEDQVATQSFIENYWDKLWANSGAHAVPARVPMFALPTAIYGEPWLEAAAAHSNGAQLVTVGHGEA